jgi:hypothetical protein
MLLPPLGGDAVGSDAATGGADRRSAKNAAAPKDQSREAHHSAWPLHSPEGCTLSSPAGRQVLAAIAASVTVLGRGSATMAGDRRRWGGGAEVSGVERGA